MGIRDSSRKLYPFLGYVHGLVMKAPNVGAGATTRRPCATTLTSPPPIVVVSCWPIRPSNSRTRFRSEYAFVYLPRWLFTMPRAHQNWVRAMTVSCSRSVSVIRSSWRSTRSISCRANQLESIAILARKYDSVSPSLIAALRAASPTSKALVESKPSTCTSSSDKFLHKLNLISLAVG